MADRARFAEQIAALDKASEQLAALDAGAAKLREAMRGERG